VHKQGSGLTGGRRCVFWPHVTISGHYPKVWPNSRMDSIFNGDLSTTKGRAVAWIDSLIVDHAVFRLAWSNLEPVVPGKIYRCNHPTPARLRRLAGRLGLRTLINLRGRTQSGSDALSREAARELGLTFHDIAFESRGAPQPDRIMRLYDIYTSMRTPAIMHCKSGADRAGLAAGLMVLFGGGTSAEALRHLSWRFGHLKQAKTGVLDAFFLRYQRDGEGRKSFLDWVREDYDAAALQQDFHANGLASFVNDWVLAHE
jgi:protein tyrosine/serine phosphatase